MSTVPYPPLSVLAHYSSQPDKVTIKPLTGGEVNYSWIITDDPHTQYVLQRISHIFNRDMITDAASITNQLEILGWEMPTTLRSISGQLYVEEVTKADTWLWRATKHIDSDRRIPPSSTALCYAYGNILARLHTSLKTITYVPIFALPHFHDTEHYLGRLATLTDSMPDNESRAYARRVTAAYDALPDLPPSPNQLIHADPRTDNMLFRDSQPLTYIDWDTVMLGNIWIDIGDRLRSFAEDYLKQTNTLPGVSLLSAFSEGYREAAGSTALPADFLQHCITAACRISLELCSRYINDVVDDHYWVWDASKFSSRRDSNMSRAKTTYQLFTYFQEMLNKKVIQ